MSGSSIYWCGLIGGRGLSPSSLLAVSRRKRKPVPRGKLVAPQSDLPPAIDLAAQIVFLARQVGLVEDHRPAAGFSVPAVAPVLQNVLEVEGRVLCPQLVLSFSRILEQQTHGKALRSLQRLGQQVEGRMAIIDGAMTIVEAAKVVHEIAKLRPFMAFLFPGDLRAGASPIEVVEKRPCRFAHRPVEFGVVGE